MKTLIAAFALLTLAAHAPGSPFHVQAGNEKKPTGEVNRQKVIEDIAVDLEDVAKRLHEDDPGALTRKAQQRILDNFDILLKQKDPSQSNPSSNTAPKPTPSSEKKPGPTPKPEATPQPKPGDTSAARPKEAAAQEAAAKANTIEGIHKNQKTKAKAERWPGLPYRHRQEIDSHARERFIRNYEEMLRAYYRNIAESSRRDP